MAETTGTCEGCGTADVEVSDEKKCVNCVGGLPSAGNGDGADKTGAAGGDSTSNEDTV